MTHSSSEYFRIYGGPASPYSLKLRAVCRYRRIPHLWLVPQSRFDGSGALGQGDLDSPLHQAAKGIVPVVQYPDKTFKADSTPIMTELETLYPDRSIVPPHPGIAFIASLIEDMTDEGLPFPMFYFRWTTDAEWCGRRQMIGWNGPLTDAELTKLSKAFIQRQQAQLGAAAQIPREAVQKPFEDLLHALETSLKKSLFFFGTRPSFAEFGLYGQLSQYVVDPFVSNLTKASAVRVFQWTQLLDDASGLDGEWADPHTCLTDELASVVSTLAPPYFALQDRAKETHGRSDLTGELRGPGYRLKCLLSLKHALAELSDDDRAFIRPFLLSTGCWDALQFEPGEESRVAPVLPQ